MRACLPALSRRKKNEVPLPHCTALPPSLTDSHLLCPSVRLPTMSICGHIRGPFAAAATAPPARERARSPSPSSRTRLRREGERSEPSPFLPLFFPYSLIHSICKHRAIPCLRNPLSLAAAVEEEWAMSLLPATNERTRAMMDFFFDQSKGPSTACAEYKDL